MTISPLVMSVDVYINLIQKQKIFPSGKHTVLIYLLFYTERIRHKVYCTISFVYSTLHCSAMLCATRLHSASLYPAALLVMLYHALFDNLVR